MLPTFHRNNVNTIAKLIKVKAVYQLLCFYWLRDTLSNYFLYNTLCHRDSQEY